MDLHSLCCGDGERGIEVDAECSEEDEGIDDDDDDDSEIEIKCNNKDEDEIDFEYVDEVKDDYRAYFLD